MPTDGYQFTFSLLSVTLTSLKEWGLDLSIEANVLIPMADWDRGSGNGAGVQLRAERFIKWIEPGPDDQPDFRFLRRDMRPHYPGQAVAVTDANSTLPQRRGPQHQFGWMRRPAQKAEIGRDLKFHVIGHPNSPCRYQSGAPPRPSPTRPLRYSIVPVEASAPTVAS